MNRTLIIPKTFSYKIMIGGAILHLSSTALSTLMILSLNFSFSLIFSLLGTLGFMIFVGGVICTFRDVYNEISICTNMIVELPKNQPNNAINRTKTQAKKRRKTHYNQYNEENIICSKCNSIRVTEYKDSGNSSYYHCLDCQFDFE